MMTERGDWRLKAQSQNLLQVRDVNFCSLLGLKEAELEDLYDKNWYRQGFRDKFGVDIQIKLPGKRRKWSAHISLIFKASGKPWNERIKHDTKSWLANFAAEHPTKILHAQSQECIDALVSNLVGRLPK
jgi:hypothetical protein